MLSGWSRPMAELRCVSDRQTLLLFGAIKRPGDEGELIGVEPPHRCRCMMIALPAGTCRETSTSRLKILFGSTPVYCRFSLAMSPMYGAANVLDWSSVFLVPWLMIRVSASKPSHWVTPDGETMLRVLDQVHGLRDVGADRRRRGRPRVGDGQRLDGRVGDDGGVERGVPRVDHRVLDLQQLPGHRVNGLPAPHLVADHDGHGAFVGEHDAGHADGGRDDGDLAELRPDLGEVVGVQRRRLAVPHRTGGGSAAHPQHGVHDELVLGDVQDERRNDQRVLQQLIDGNPRCVASNPGRQ